MSGPSGLPAGRYRPIKPLIWPQDQLDSPDGYGTVPSVNAINLQTVKREFFAYNKQIPGLAVGASSQITFTIDPDGDFWLDSIAIRATGGGQATGDEAGIVPGWFQIEDLSQNYNLMVPAAPGAALWPFMPFTADQTGLARGVLAGVRTSIIEPYCFLRNGGVKITASIAAYAPAGTDYALYFSLSGWKEYQNAAI